MHLCFISRCHAGPAGFARGGGVFVRGTRGTVCEGGAVPVDRAMVGPSRPPIAGPGWPAGLPRCAGDGLVARGTCFGLLSRLTFVHSFIHSFIHSFVHSCIHHSFIYTYIHTYIHTYMHTYYTHTYIHSFIQSFIYSCILMPIHSK